ncbi:MAG TPA: gephyrin-like molybdotransferase Glp [Stellaceae bacterium]|jgi:molybdopterin molybdotransferase|nr:gephyrin-like molybdotransferase Glp [Stellaceae bacterium]
MISVDEARSRLLAPLSPAPLEQLGLASCVGRVLAEDVAARRTQPPFAVSAMDGYAVRADDVAKVPATLRIVAEIPAGAGYAGRLGEGEAARIFTGAPLPAGSDTIVIQEDTVRDGDRVEVREGAARGTYVRKAGLDFAEGDTLLHAGKRLTPRDIGLAAAMNRPWLFVHRRPRVAILSTGDEIVMPGDPIGPHQIVSSNLLALAAFVTACGAEPVMVGNAPDDPDALRHIAAAARGVDLFVTTGGVSVGEHDLVRGVLSEDGLSIDFWEIAMRPGKPLMFGHYRNTPMVGLPGNPVATLVCSLIFLKPAINRLAGLPDNAEQPVPARLGVAVKQNDRRQDYLRARLVRGPDGVPEVVPFDRQDSSMLHPLAQSDCLVIRPPHGPALPAGSEVPIISFGGTALPL